MYRWAKSVFELLVRTASEWINQDVARLGAATAFYTLFAIAPLFIIVLAIAGYWFGEEAARRELFSQVSGLVGSEGGEAIQALVSAANKPQTSAWASMVGVATLLVGSTGAFIQLQDSLNSVWGVRRVQGRGLLSFVKDRLLSFAIVIGMGFLLLVSLILSTVLSAAGTLLSGLLPAQATIWQAFNFVISFGVITLLFAMIFKVLPDVRIAWRDVWIGALITTTFFNLGKFFLGLYLGHGAVVSAYGAAGSLVIVLLWVYYSAQILFFGAKFTQVYANMYGSHFEPLKGTEAAALKRQSPKGSRLSARSQSA